jgi:2-keto-4-pentenoate hydratase
VMGRTVDNPHATVADVIRATEFALAAIEIVDSRIAQWRIGLFDTIADNASNGAFVLGADPVKLSDVKLRDARMHMTRLAGEGGGEEVSSGIGSACLGHPLNAAAWLARTLSRIGEPLQPGDVVLTGALGPMVVAQAGDRFEARIEGLGAVSVRFVG